MNVLALLSKELYGSLAKRGILCEMIRLLLS